MKRPRRGWIPLTRRNQKVIHLGLVFVGVEFLICKIDLDSFQRIIGAQNSRQRHRPGIIRNNSITQIFTHSILSIKFTGNNIWINRSLGRKQSRKNPKIRKHCQETNKTEGPDHLQQAQLIFSHKSIMKKKTQISTD